MIWSPTSETVKLLKEGVDIFGPYPPTLSELERTAPWARERLHAELGARVAHAAARPPVGAAAATWLPRRL